MGRPKAGSSPPTKKPISCWCPIDSTVGTNRWRLEVTKCDKKFYCSFKFWRKNSTVFFPETEPMMPMEWLKLPSEHNNKVCSQNQDRMWELWHFAWSFSSDILYKVMHTHTPKRNQKMLDTLQIQTVIYKLHKLSPSNCSTTVNSQGLRDYLVAEIVSLTRSLQLEIQ